ncbi:MAG: hypothetical protein K2W94_00555 [Alphaproteobacteria bacterium]|nr:hypothetical protein [Alphaproteobacteria bacterium]
MVHSPKNLKASGCLRFPDLPNKRPKDETLLEENSEENPNFSVTASKKILFDGSIAQRERHTEIAKLCDESSTLRLDAIMANAIYPRIFNKQQQKILKETLEKRKEEILCDSLEITHHHQIAQMVLRNTGVFLDNKEKHILAYLSTFAKTDGSHICVSYTTIKKETGWCKRTITSVIQCLKDKGFLKETKPSSAQKKTPAIFAINLEKLVGLAHDLHQMQGVHQMHPIPHTGAPHAPKHKDINIRIYRADSSQNHDILLLPSNEEEIVSSWQKRNSQFQNRENIVNFSNASKNNSRGILDENQSEHQKGQAIALQPQNNSTEAHVADEEKRGSEIKNKKPACRGKKQKSDEFSLPDERFALDDLTLTVLPDLIPQLIEAGLHPTKIIQAWKDFEEYWQEQAHIHKGKKTQQGWKRAFLHNVKTFKQSSYWKNEASGYCSSENVDIAATMAKYPPHSSIHQYSALVWEAIGFFPKLDNNHV